MLDKNFFKGEPVSWLSSSLSALSSLDGSGLGIYHKSNINSRSECTSLCGT